MFVLPHNIQAALEANDFKQAEALIQVLLETEPSAILWQTLGDVHVAQTRFSEAEKSYLMSLELSPEASVYNNLGVLAQQSLNYDSSLEYYLKALALDDKNPMYAYNISCIYALRGHRENTLAYAKKTLEISPTYAMGFDALGQALAMFGDANAVNAYQQAIYLDRKSLKTYYRLGQLFQSRRDFESAILWYERLIDMQVTHEDLRDRQLLSLSYHMLAFSYREQGRVSEAIQAYETALQICPTDTTVTALHLFLPPMYQSNTDLAEVRARFEQGVSELEKLKGEMIDPVSQGLLTPFYLAYQGKNDRHLLERLGRFFSSFQPSDLTLSIRYPGERIRIGFVSNCFFSHSISDYFSGLILGLPQDTFEVFLFSTTEMQEDAVTEALKQGVDHFFVMSSELSLMHKTIAQKTLDILVYPDIGMDPMTYFLAMTRLAPQQCALMGHPVTTGLISIDHYISSQWQEPENASAHYTENLVQLKNIPTFYKKPDPPIARSRQYFKLPKLGHLYICPQTLYKIHPDFDAILQEILDLDRKAFIVFFKEPSTFLHTDLQMRFKKTITRKNHRIKFIPRLNFSDFLALLKEADVILDPIHFGGGSTSYLAFAMNAPVVTWPGEFLRGRTTYALYQSMGITEGIALDRSNYAKLAVKIAQETAYRDMLKHKLAEHSDALFSNQAAVSELARFFQDLVRK